MAAGGWVWFPVCPLSEVNFYSSRPSGAGGLSAVRISEVRNTLLYYIWADRSVPRCVSVIRYTEVVRISEAEGPLTEVPL